MRRILYFTADWCRPCKRFGPALAKEATARGIELVTVDVDADVDGVALAHDVLSLPTVIVFDGESIIGRFGALSTSALQQRLDHLGLRA